MNEVQAWTAFLFSWLLLLTGVYFLFGFAALRGEALAKYTGNTLLLFLALAVVLPLGLGAYGITALWGIWR